MAIKIALVTPWAVRCGIYTYSQDLALALAQEDCEIFVVRLPRFGHKTVDIMLDVAERVPYKDVDLIHVQHEYGLFQGLEAPFFTQLRMGGKPIVTTCHAVGNYEIDVLISGVSNKVIVHNEFCLNRFGLPNAVIIPHGTTPTLATECEKAKQSMGIEKTSPVVGYLGYISNYKGLETLIHAMVKVPKAGLMICGGWHVEGETMDYIEKLREWSKKLLDKRVKWIGYVPDDRMADAYGAMTVLVYPSRFATESGSLLHGIAYGRAVIASNVAPFKEKENMGILQTFDNVDDLAKKIQFLLDNPCERLKLSEAATKYAEKTSWSNIAKLHVELYRKLLGAVKVD